MEHWSLASISELEKDWPGTAMLLTAVVVAVSVLLLNSLSRLALNLLRKKYGDQATLASAVIITVGRPLRILVWIIGVLVVSHLAADCRPLLILFIQ